MSTKLTAAQIKQLPKPVAEKVDALKKRYRTRQVRLEMHDPTWRLYLAEGASYTFFAPNGKTMSTRMVSESTLGAMNDGLNYHVGERAPAFPAGTWVVEFELFLGKPFVTVHHVSVPALAG